MEGEWPSSVEETEILAGYGAVSVSLNVSLNQESFDTVSAAIISAQKPILIHCRVIILNFKNEFIWFWN